MSAMYSWEGMTFVATRKVATASLMLDTEIVSFCFVKAVVSLGVLGALVQRGQQGRRLQLNQLVLKDLVVNTFLTIGQLSLQLTSGASSILPLELVQADELRIITTITHFLF